MPNKETRAKTNKPGLVLPELAQWACEESAVIASEDAPFRASFIEGDPRVLLVVGENASGKSLLFRLISSLAAKKKILAVTISIRERTGSGQHEMAGMARAFMFGNETERSTGANSASVVKSGFNNVRRETATILGLDEPELGLSDGYAEALGEYIGQQSTNLDDTCGGVVVVTHNRRLVRGLLRGLGASPSIVSMTERPLTVEQWLSMEERKTIDDLLALEDVALDRFRQTQKILDSK